MKIHVENPLTRLENIYFFNLDDGPHPSIRTTLLGGIPLAAIFHVAPFNFRSPWIFLIFLFLRLSFGRVSLSLKFIHWSSLLSMSRCLFGTSFDISLFWRHSSIFAPFFMLTPKWYLIYFSIALYFLHFVILCGFLEVYSHLVWLIYCFLCSLVFRTSSMLQSYGQI